MSSFYGSERRMSLHVVTATDHSDELVRGLEALHARLWNSGLKWAGSWSVITYLALQYRNSREKPAIQRSWR